MPVGVQVFGWVVAHNSSQSLQMTAGQSAAEGWVGMPPAACCCCTRVVEGTVPGSDRATGRSGLIQACDLQALQATQWTIIIIIKGHSPLLFCA